MSGHLFRQLLQRPAPNAELDPAIASAHVDESALADLYRHPVVEGRGWLRTNFVSTLDGSTQGPDGRSGSINTPSDQHIFALQRANADAIVVGAQTARTEGYRGIDLAPWQLELRAALGLRPYPLLVIISRSLELDPAMASTEDGPVMIITDEDSEPDLAPFRDAGCQLLQLGVGDVDLPAALDALAGQGYQRITCEGGAHLHHALLAADLVDEMCLTFSPMVVGGPGLRTTNGPTLTPPATFALEHLLLADDDTLFCRYLLKRV